MTAKLAHPYRKPSAGWYASRREAHCPPASGYAAASSAIESAPSNETTPPTTQTSVAAADPGSAALTVAGTMKIAEAIIVPTLIIVESKRPSSRRRSVGVLAGRGDEVTGPKLNVGRVESWKVLPSNRPTVQPSNVRARRQYRNPVAIPWATGARG